MAFVNIDKRYSSALAIIAGIILTLTRPVLSNLVPGTASNPWLGLFTSLSSNGLTVFSVLAGILAILVQIGGVTISLGGLLCYANHLRSGKELVGIGTTFGLVDLLTSIPSLASGSYGPPLWIAWVGLFCAVFADRHIKGPKDSYAGEVRKLLVWKRERQARRVRARKRATRMAGVSARPYKLGSNSDD
ncbi:hypothetical protein E6H13_05160 [Candidatus Bathyarchaeota archaeon]|nr:MAG: hypothetical protein E6H13_05160 [Candidatus Bathyarchaeota archaeon]